MDSRVSTPWLRTPSYRIQGWSRSFAPYPDIDISIIAVFNTTQMPAAAHYLYQHEWEQRTKEVVRLSRAEVCLPNLWPAGNAGNYAPSADMLHNDWPLASKNMVRDDKAASDLHIGAASLEVHAIFRNGTILDP